MKYALLRKGDYKPIIVVDTYEEAERIRGDVTYVDIVKVEEEKGER